MAIRRVCVRVIGTAAVIWFVAGAIADEAIRGTVKFKADEKPIVLKKIKEVADNPFCAAKWQGKKLRPEKVVNNENGTLRFIFVYIKSGVPKQKWDAPEERVLLDQVNCRYEPHVFGAMAGQTIRVRNSDGTSHNIHAQPKANRGFNFAQTKKGQKRDKSFKNPEMAIRVKCDVHPWMLSWVHVMDHPFFDTTGEDGAFEIKIAELPDGEYELEAWSEYFKPKTAKVTIKGGKVASGAIEFTFERADKK